MISENVLLGLKYGGSLISGAYGLYATLTDFHTEKDGKRRLSARGYFGIGLLLASTSVALLSDVVSDTAEREQRVQQDSVRNEERKAEIARQKELVDSLSRALVTLDATSHNVNKTAGLSLQAVTQGQLLASGLERTADVVNDNATQTAIVLRENRERVDNYRFEFLLNIDPLEFDKLTGHRLLEPALRAALERSGSEELDTATRRKIDSRLSAAKRELREAILTRWSGGLDLSKKDPATGRSIFAYNRDFQGTDYLDGVQVYGYLNSRRRTPSGVPTLTAVVVYSLPLHGAGHQVTLQDLDGAEVLATLNANKQLVSLESIHGIAGEASSSAMAEKIVFYRDTLGSWPGDWTTVSRIPKNYYAAMIRGLSKASN